MDISRSHRLSYIASPIRSKAFARIHFSTYDAPYASLGGARQCVAFSKLPADLIFFLILSSRAYSQIRDKNFLQRDLLSHKCSRTRFIKLHYKLGRSPVIRLVQFSFPSFVFFFLQEEIIYFSRVSLVFFLYQHRRDTALDYYFRHICNSISYH